MSCGFSVFSRDEFNLGGFTEMEHKIDTGDAKAIKERIRLTAACFVGEDEINLKKDVGCRCYSPINLHSITHKKEGWISTLVHRLLWVEQSHG